MKGEVVELGRHSPTVDSVIERLDRYRGKIRSITCVVEWKDGPELTVAHNSKSLSELCFEAKTLDMYVQALMED